MADPVIISPYYTGRPSPYITLLYWLTLSLYHLIVLADPVPVAGGE
jgi:hypothetical protein